MHRLLEQLNNLLSLDQWPTLATGLRITLFALILIACIQLWKSPLPNPTKKASALPWAYRTFLLILTTSFALLLIHQAHWQLAGQSNPKFVAFMQRHDRRPFNPAHNIQRGNILDRNGQILATTPAHKKQAKRHYPYAQSTAHVIGYAHPKYGTFGMEKSGNAILTGATLSNLQNWKNLGEGLLDNTRQVKGQNLTLTLDIRLHKQAYHLLGNRKGAVIMLDIKTGDLLICASTPSFDPHQIDDKLFSGQRGDSILLNRATHGQYPPGSTLKTFTAAVAIETGLNPSIHCPAKGWSTSQKYPPIRDYGYYAAKKNNTPWAGYGTITLPTALAKSSNIYFARLGVQLGIDTLHDNAQRMLFNQRIPLHRSLTSKTTVPGGHYPRLSTRDHYGLAQISMGQGKVLTTPLHMALITAAIANQGIAPRPRLSLDQKPANLPRFMQASTASQIGSMMRKAVTQGTGRRINRSDLTVAGKTGTADHGGTKPHAWFIAYAPYQHPRYAITVLIENGGFGSATALPIANQLLTSAIKYNHLQATP